jgi:two-component system, LytTR family, sensor kinase
MIKTLYKRYPYFFNLLIVLVLVQVTRILDWLAWNPDYPGKTRDILLNHFFEFVSFLPIIMLIIISYKWALKRKSIIVLWLLIILYTVFGMVMILFLSTWLELIFVKSNVLPVTFNLIVRYSTMGYLIFLFFNATFYLTYLQLQSSKQIENAHRAETLAKDVQLKMLRYQINPHFLFNVLNSIYTLIDENTEKAKKLVVDMSEYYRYTLNKQQQIIPVEKEVESILKYLEIQKTRFEDEFHYVISVDEASKSVSIPSFLIHLLIENAIKYGTKTMKQRLIVDLSVKLVNKSLLIRVANTGKLLPATPSSGNTGNGTSNGIENLKNRLGLYYNDSFSFSLKEEDGWVIADIKIDNIDAK